MPWFIQGLKASCFKPLRLCAPLWSGAAPSGVPPAPHRLPLLPCSASAEARGLVGAAHSAVVLHTHPPLYRQGPWAQEVRGPAHQGHRPRALSSYPAAARLGPQDRVQQKEGSDGAGGQPGACSRPHTYLASSSTRSLYRDHAGSPSPTSTSMPVLSSPPNHCSQKEVPGLQSGLGSRVLGAG